jgi:hypothetical protein
MMTDGNTLLTSTRETLTRFWDQTLQIVWQRDHLVLAFPLMLHDGVQAVFELEPITATSALLTDGGRTLSALSGLGINLDKGATAHLLDQRLAFFELERDGFEIRRPAKLPVDPIEVQLFAEGLVSIAHLLYRQEPDNAEENVARKSVDRLFAQRGLSPIHNHPLEGRLEKAIRVSHYLPGSHGLALQMVDRKTDIHGYMQQWGWRWTDLHEKQPNLIRAMVYDPDRQDWDATSLEIGRAVCEVFCPYHDSTALTDAIERAR